MHGFKKMNDWQNILDQVQMQREVWARNGCDTPFYRGHRIATWKLLCSLGRGEKNTSRAAVESALYYDFLSLGGPLFSGKTSSWEVIFTMQHHGLPTRLLDWTHTFAVALYFAIRPMHIEPSSKSKTACVWMMNPFELNKNVGNDSAVYNPEIDLEGDYYENFICESKTLGVPVMAVNPIRSALRQSAQRSVFTLHNEISKPLEEHAPEYLVRIDIPENCFAEAADFLSLAGINEYTLFPDFDGLARQLLHEHGHFL